MVIKIEVNCENIFQPAHCVPKNFMPNAEPSDLTEAIDSARVRSRLLFALSYQITGENANDWLYARIKNEDRLVGFGTRRF